MSSISPLIDLELRLTVVRGHLRELRGERSLRDWCSFLEERAGYRTSPPSVLRQENGESGLDGEFLLAVQVATGASPSWMMLDEGQKYGARAHQLGAPADHHQHLLPEGVARELTLRCDSIFAETKNGHRAVAMAV